MTLSHQPYYDSSSGAKVMTIFEITKYIPVFLASLLMTFETIVASCVTPVRKVDFRLRPITQCL